MLNFVKSYKGILGIIASIVVIFSLVIGLVPSIRNITWDRVVSPAWLGSSYYILKTDTNITADGIKILTDRTVTYVVAASNAPALEKTQADYRCDGTADNVEIQAAITTCNGKGLVKLTEGTYYIAAAITCSNGVSIEGVPKSTILKTVSGNRTFDLSDKHDIAFKDLIFFGDYTISATGSFAFLATSTCYNISFKDIEVYDFGESGFKLYSGHDIKIENCYVHDLPANKYGISFYGDEDQYNIWIKNCYVKTVGSGGIFFSADTSGKMNHDIWVVNNLLDGCGTDGIWIGGLDSSSFNYNIHILGNTCLNCTNNDGILAQNIYDSEIIGNICKGNAGDGLAIGGLGRSNHTIVKGNIFTDNDGRGIFDGGALNTYMSYIGNILTDNGMGNTITLGIGTIVQDNEGYLSPGELRTYSDSLVAGVVGNAVIAWQNPEVQPMMVTGRTRITTGATLASTGDWGLAITVQVVEDCEDVWTDGTHGTCAVNTTYVERGTNCNAITIASGITNDDKIAYEDFGALDISTATHLTFKFRSTVALNAADIAIMLDEDSGCASPSFTLNFPAIVANSTTLVCLPINGGAAAGATVDALISVGLQVLINTRAVAGTIFYIDDIRAITVGSDLINDANLQTLGIANYTTPIHLDDKNDDDADSHDTLVMVSAVQASTGLVGSWYITGQGE